MPASKSATAIPQSRDMKNLGHRFYPIAFTVTIPYFTWPEGYADDSIAWRWRSPDDCFFRFDPIA
jgi:hypothetical protein